MPSSRIRTPNSMKITKNGPIQNRRAVLVRRNGSKEIIAPSQIQIYPNELQKETTARSSTA